MWRNGIVLVIICLFVEISITPNILGSHWESSNLDIKN